MRKQLLLFFTTLCCLSVHASNLFAFDSDIFHWIFSFDWTLGSILKWIIIIIPIGILIIRVLLEYVCTILGFGMGVWAVTLLVSFALKYKGIIDSTQMWIAAEWGFKIGCGIGVLFCVFNVRKIFNNVFDGPSTYVSSGSGSSSGGGGSDRDYDSWHGTVHDHPDGSRYIEYENGNYSYITSESCGHARCQDGTTWEIYGSSARRVEY